MKGQDVKKLIVYDPPMCCSTGICGPVVDPVLPRFAADLEWLKGQGVEVKRYNLAQQPFEFAQDAKVKQALKEKGNACLPLIVVDGKIVSEGEYLTLEKMSELLGLKNAVPTSLFSDAIAELVAIGAAIASNCEPCFRFHYDRAKKLGVSKEDMARAVAVAQSVKEAPARSIIELADKYLGTKSSLDREASTPVSAEQTSKPKSKCCGS